MSRTARPSTRRRRGVLVPLALVALGSTGLAVVGSGAVFTDTQSIGANAFTAGTVKLTTTPTTAAVTLTTMAPGDSKVGSITVSNAGSLAQRYAVVSTADNNDSKGLAAQLLMTVKTGVTACTSAGFATDGTVVYGPSVFGTTAGTKVIGDSTQGSQAGDRTLAALASENLCVLVSLPLATGNVFQNATTTAVLTFNAEQTANN